MKSTVEQLSPTRVRINVEVPFAELKPDFDAVYAQLAQQVRIPGFRPGKAPAKLIESRVGRGSVIEQVLQSVVPSRYSEAVANDDVKALGQPDIEVTKIEDGDHIAFTAEVDVRPEIALPDFSEIDVTVDSVTVDDEAVDEQLDALRARFGTLTGVERGIENGVTRFHDVEVPVKNRLGKEGAGLKIALSTLNTGRLSIPALCVGAGKWSLKIAREWSNVRVQWGKPVGQHESVGKKIAYIAASTFAMEAVFELSAALADAGMKDVRIEAALAKLFTSEVASKIADELLQIRGGRGYETAASQKARGERAVPVEQMLRDLRINRIFEGSTEIMHLLIAREAVDAHLKAAGDLANRDADLQAKAKAAMGASGFYAKWLPTLAVGSGLLPNSFSDHGRLAKNLRYIERSSRRLARHTFGGMATWQAGLESHQAFLGRVVDIGAELFAMAACISRVELMRTQDPDNAESAELLTMAFCEQSEHRCEALFRDLWANSDKTDRKLSTKVLAGDFTWLESGIIDASEGTGEWIAPWSTESMEDKRQPYGP